TATGLVNGVPLVPEKYVDEAGVTRNTGRVMTIVKLLVCVPPPFDTLTVPLYEPGAIPCPSGATVNRPAPVPEAEDRAIQGADAVALQAPPFPMFKTTDGPAWVSPSTYCQVHVGAPVNTGVLTVIV